MQLVFVAIGLQSTAFTHTVRDLHISPRDCDEVAKQLKRFLLEVRERKAVSW